MNKLYILLFFLCIATTTKTMLVKQIIQNPVFHKKTIILPIKHYCTTPIKQKQNKSILSDQIFYKITDNLWAHRDAQTWETEIQNLVKNFPNDKKMIYDNIDCIIKKHSIPNPEVRLSIKPIKKIFTYALIPTTASATVTASVYTFLYSIYSTAGLVGDTPAEKLLHAFIGVLCAWGATGCLAILTYCLLESANSDIQPNERTADIRKYKNICILKKIHEQYQQEINSDF